jgi:hypothetical protein
MAMQKVSKTKREMFDAFTAKYKNVPSVFIARSLDYHDNLGKCFDSIMDYDPCVAQEFDVEKNDWQSKTL